ncbi:DUF4232 domain-containing protein [Streptomyces chartreusis]|uniref:DUF4232 domain-containing protein n=1 Tax=Streptomyces chartreusis TaxID=1969 RepID=A0A7H8T950_STRCX|nr:MULTISPECIES: DUF4232 domain-containing protein [Streptomyces]MBT1092553.1 DUF4232 domain-containing protein [Streptomyces sp. Tu102]QKZ19947.1 DUF4232 domain-containing protein [Streptomyces chartreusis]RSO06281.1 DUF4232 domain-containing protein [Streptomyces sp. WAC 05379]
MFGNRRKALLVSAALVGGAMLMTACQDSDATKDTGAAKGSSSAPGKAGDSGSSSGSSSTGGGKDTAKGDGGSGKGTDDGAGSGADTGNGGREQVEQSCGANDISWSTRSETQAGGYILVIAKAKPGITCYLPAELPTVAFGSDGTQAGPAEQSVGEQIKLSGSTAAYAGVNPKSTNTDGGKELDSIIVAVGDNDPDPVSLPVGTITVDKPIVTNWHTAPTDAVPFS